MWRRVVAVLATLSLALFVAAAIAREPPDLSGSPVVAVIRDGEWHPVWEIRLARAAHELAADSAPGAAIPPGRTYQLWLVGPGSATPRQLGLLPGSGRRLLPVSPETVELLGGGGELFVSLEPPGGSPYPLPSGPAVFRGLLQAPG